jgi:serine/threonine-protein kinase HipA
MARDAGITMTECRLMQENGRRHFMTRRFDRDADGAKRHMQSLAALAHFDFRQAGAYSYEQAFAVIHALGLDAAAVRQQFRRMVFNVVGRNQDDHVKNIAFLMDRTGRWELSPAFDIVYSYNPAGNWTAALQMSLAGKRDGFDASDFRQVGRVARLKRGEAERILGDVCAVVSDWPRYAKDVAVDDKDIQRITPAID